MSCKNIYPYESALFFEGHDQYNNICFMMKLSNDGLSLRGIYSECGVGSDCSILQSQFSSNLNSSINVSITRRGLQNLSIRSEALSRLRIIPAA